MTVNNGGPGSGGSGVSTVDVNGTAQTQRPALNLIAGAGVTISGADNSGASRTDVTINSTGGGVGYVVAPSGDATGATDKANINTALGAHSEVWLQGSYTINGAISMPSNTTLILADASIFLANASNSNLIKNADHTGGSGGNSNIRILGIGKALLDGNQANQTSGESWTSHGIVMSHVTTFEIGHLQIQNTTRYGISPQHSSDWVVHDIWGSIVGSTEQAIVQALGDNSNCVIERIRGVSEDDSVGASTGEIAAYQGLYADNAATGNIADLVIRDVEVTHTTSATVNTVRLFCGGGYKIQRITIDNVRERFPTQAGQAITLGSDSFSTTPPAPTDFADITIRNTNGRIIFQSPCQGIVIDGIEIPPAAATSGAPGPIQFEGSAAGRTISDLLIDNVVYNGGAQANPLISFNDKGGTLTINRLNVGQNVKMSGPLTGLVTITGTGVKLNGLRLPEINPPLLAAAPASGANYLANVANANVFAGNQSVAAAGGGWAAATPDGTKLYVMGVSNAGAATLTRVPYFAKLIQSLGPVAYLRLNESSGTVAADQMGTFNGAYQAAPTLGSATLLGTNSDDTATSVAFTRASSQYVLCPDGAAVDFLKAFSIVLLAKPTAVNVFQGLVSKGNGATIDYGLSIDGSGHLNFTYNTSNFLTDTAALVAATTYLIAVTWDGANLRFYVAGTLGTSPALSATLNATSGSNLYIARRSDGNYFGGSIQEVAIFPYALSASAITQLHNIAGV